MATDIHCPNCGEHISGDLLSADQMRKRFFSCIAEAHSNFSDEMKQRFPTSEALRKQALIAVGHCDIETIACGEESVAQRFAARERRRDRYSIVHVDGSVLTILTAQSMARKFLLKAEFLDVQQKAFDWIYQTTGIDCDMSSAARAA